MKCKFCESPNPDKATKCENCGKNLDVDQSDSNGFSLSYDPLKFSTGQMFGNRYQIIEEIGKGGMGKVFKAFDHSRFKRELLIAREIAHENVIRIHDIGEIEKIKYISMNYIDGISLNDIIASIGRLNIVKSIDIFRQISNALDAAHKKKIVHRDLKPQNIMLDKKGKVYVLDFGIARSDGDTTSTTATGVVIGTPDIMSPEQIQGLTTDKRSDIYAIGVIMFQTVTGRLPFFGDNFSSLLYQHVNEPPPAPSEFNPFLPAKLERIILKCMAKKPEDRYQSLKEIIKDIDQIKLNKLTSSSREKLGDLIAPDVCIEEEITPKKNYAFLKFSIITMLMVVFIYGLISVISMVNDSVFGDKIEKIHGEYNIYYRNLFPIKKTWGPLNNKTADTNVWDIFQQIFPNILAAKTNPNIDHTKTEAYVKNILISPFAEKFNNFISSYTYKDLDELLILEKELSKEFNFKKLYKSLPLSELNPFSTIKNGKPLNMEVFLQYLKMTRLQARIDFWQGNFKDALSKIYHFLLVSYDLMASATYPQETNAAIQAFSQLSQELIPGILNVQIHLNHFIMYLTHLSPTHFIPLFLFRSPKMESQFKSTGLSIAHLEGFIPQFIALLKIDNVIYKNQLHLSKQFENIESLFGIKNTDYFYYKKFKFWNYGFSRNKYFFKNGIEFYKGLMDGLKYASNPRDKIAYITNYKIKNGVNNNPMEKNITHIPLSILLSRLYGKLAVISIKLAKYGYFSKAFSDLKETDIFINDFTNQKFAVSLNKKGIFLEITNSFKINLQPINYSHEHKDLLQTFTIFNSLNPDKILSLFQVNQNK